MELKLPYINPVNFARSLVKDYGFTRQEVWNAEHIQMPASSGKGSLLIFIRDDIHFFRGKWAFNERTTFHSSDQVGKKGIVDFRISASGQIQSAAIEGCNKFEFDTTNVDGMRIFIPEKYLPDDRNRLFKKFDHYCLNPDINNLQQKLFSIDYTETGNSILLESKILEFIFFWMEYLKKEDIGKYFKSLTDHQLSCLKTAKTILDEDIANPMHIKELSRKSGINECDLKKGFRQLYGLPVRQYIIKSRLEHARTLITKTDAPIQEICAEMGYTNRGHFAKLYQKYFGLTPLNDRYSFTGNNINSFKDIN
jgi:AraC-like DNA-binding protein